MIAPGNPTEEERKHVTEDQLGGLWQWFGRRGQWIRRDKEGE